jgi:hypothetical protein
MVESNPGLGTSGCLSHSEDLWTVRHFLSKEVLVASLRDMGRPSSRFPAR